MSDLTKQQDEPDLKKSFMSKEVVVRLISALVLGAVTLFLAYFSWASFLGLCALIGVWMSVEWGKLTNNDTPLQLAIQIGTITIALLAFVLKEPPLFFASLIGGAFLAAWAAHYWWRSKWALLGLVYVGAPVLSFLYLRDDPLYGFYAVLFILLVVWGSDTAAYFAGRHFGGKKLAPTISPGKTWSGSIGGLFAGLIIGALYAISINAEPVILGLIGLVLSALSQVGDLTESSIKRHFGVKDSGTLIPGHGGILDRLDAVVFAVVGAALIAMVRSHESPSQALLFWSA